MMTAAKFPGADAAVAPKKSGEIRRILEAQLAGDAAHRTRGVDQAAPSFQRQPLLNQIEGCDAGQPPTGAVQLSGCANSCANRSSSCAARSASCGSARRSMARGMENNVSIGP